MLIIDLRVSIVIVLDANSKNQPVSKTSRCPTILPPTVNLALGRLNLYS